MGTVLDLLVALPAENKTRHNSRVFLSLRSAKQTIIFCAVFYRSLYPPQALRNSTLSRISSADLVATNLKRRRICSPTE
jgi:hypothetical protein